MASRAELAQETGDIKLIMVMHRGKLANIFQVFYKLRIPDNTLCLCDVNGHGFSQSALALHCLRSRRGLSIQFHLYQSLNRETSGSRSRQTT
jgi:hypothetical protein